MKYGLQTLTVMLRKKNKPANLAHTIQQLYRPSLPPPGRGRHHFQPLTQLDAQ